MNKHGRNDPCPCGSGKKYKQCCLKRDEGMAEGRAETVTIPQAIRVALQHHQAGQLAVAEGIYRQILQVEPAQPDALHLLGYAAHQQGRNALAVDLICRAIGINPDIPEYYVNLGAAYIALGEMSKAIENCEKALALRPDFAEAHNNFGNALQNLNRLNDAVACYRRAIETRPNFAEAHYNLGKALSAQGRLEEAVAAYRNTLVFSPGVAHLHNNLGDTLRSLGKLEEAGACFRDALAIDPQYAEACNNLGVVLREQGKLDEAINFYRQALNFNPDSVEAHCNLGTALTDKCRLDEAASHYRQALLLRPEHAEAHFSLGNVLKQMGELEKAVEHYHQALSLKPGYAEAHNNLGAVLADKGRPEEAIEHYRQALFIRPDYVEAYSNLGNALMARGKLDEAIGYFHQALSIEPGHAEAHNGLGTALMDTGRLEEACDHYHRALSVKPGSAEAHNNLGNVLKDQGRLEEAAECYRTAIALQPGFAEAHNNLGIVLKDQGRLDEAVACYRKAIASRPDYAQAYSNLLFTLNFDPRIGGEEIYRVAREYESTMGFPPQSSWPAHNNDRHPVRRLRVGYVSADFRNHAVACFAEPILASHDKSQVEIFCYSGVKAEDEFTSRFRQLADHWHSTVGVSDEAMAQMIRQHQIDILIDLAGHTAGNRLPVFARKPAPVQIGYLGYPGTTGLSAMDYRITDHYADPEGSDAYYSEKLLRLPDSLCCYRPAAAMAEVGALPALQNGYVTFGSLNNFNKVNDQCIALWAELLRAVPNSRLLMLTLPEGEVREQLKQKFAALDISPDRLELHGKFSPAEFFRMFRRVDIALDPFPVTGGTTTCEALWMGLPVIVLVGQRFISRVGYSFLSAAGLRDFAVDTPEDYIRVASHLASDVSLLSEIRDNMRAGVAASPLADAVAFTRNLEALYRQAWEAWCNTAN